MKFIIYHDKNLNFAKYVIANSSLQKFKDKLSCDIQIEQLPNNNAKGFPKLADKVRELLFFAKPDVVICLDDETNPIVPVFAFELTNHVPARDHWLQRFNNLVGCAQMSVAGAYIIPFDLSERENFSGEVDGTFFYAYDRVMEIHNTPFYIAEWESNKKSLNADSEYPDLPDRNSKPIKNVFTFLNKVISYLTLGKDIQSLMKDRLIVNLRNDIRKKAYSKIPKVSDFGRLNHQINKEYLSYQDFTTWLKEKKIKFPKYPELPDRIQKRDKYLIFTPAIGYRGKDAEVIREKLNIRIKDKGADPYLGQPLAFDYLFCRLGETPYDRDCNLVIDLTVLEFIDIAQYHTNIWTKCPLQHENFSEIKNVPKYTMFLTKGCPQIMKNFLRVYSFTADIIILKDAFIYF